MRRRRPHRHRAGDAAFSTRSVRLKNRFATGNTGRCNLVATVTQSGLSRATNRNESANGKVGGQAKFEARRPPTPLSHAEDAATEMCLSWLSFRPLRSRCALSLGNARIQRPHKRRLIAIEWTLFVSGRPHNVCSRLRARSRIMICLFTNDVNSV